MITEIIKNNLTITITITDNGKSARIRPKGFWSEPVQVDQDMDIRTMKLKEQPKIRWSIGGEDDTVSHAELVSNFIEALKEALLIREEWMKDGV